MTTKDIAETIQAVLMSIGIVVAAYWAFRRLIYLPRIEMSVDVVFVGLHKEHWVVELLCILENKGHVPHSIGALYGDLVELKSSDDIEIDREKFGGQLALPHGPRKFSWVPKNVNPPAKLHPGIKMRYSYTYAIHKDTQFVLLHSVMNYGTKKAQTRADRLCRVPDSVAWKLAIDESAEEEAS